MKLCDSGKCCKSESDKEFLQQFKEKKVQWSL